MRRYLHNFRSETSTVLIGIGFSQIMAGVMFLFFQKRLEYYAIQYLVNVPAYRIHLIANVIWRLDILVGLGLITLGFLRLRKKIIVRSSSSTDKNNENENRES